MNKPNVAILFGGDSSESVVSVKSGANVFAAIDKDKFTPWLVEIKGNHWNVLLKDRTQVKIDRSDFSFSVNEKRITFDFAYITIHGTPGEDGILQGYFDLLKIPYSTSSMHSSSLTFNKWFCSNYLRNFGISMAKSLLLSKGTAQPSRAIIDKLGLPLFVKPNAGGSSFGITKVKRAEELNTALEKAWEESSEAIVEEFIEGTEVTCGLVQANNKKIIFPVTEVVPKNDFFDFEAKYTPGVTDEITPARLPEDLYENCRHLSSEIYSLCQCSGIARIDFILKGRTFYFLEINTTPGMTETSFIPQQIKAMGLSLTDILSLVIEDKLQINTHAE